MDNWQYEKELFNEGYNIVCGVDEVGRGPLVGPVVTACVVLPRDFVLEGLTDSKKLTEKKRDKYYDYIINNCTAYAVGECSPEEIDKYNILGATKIAMKRAIDKVNEQIKIDYVLIDGNMKFDFDYKYKSIVKGDSKSISIAAASVVAKVTRDRMLYELDEKYPMYGFKNHKGYPTKAHLEAINKYGLIDGYRKSYGPVMEILKKSKKEKRDLYDINSNKTNLTYYKDDKIPEGYYPMVVMIAIQNSKGEFLMQKRVKEKGGDYGVTGGHPKSGETPYEGIITEVKEELGIDISDKKIIEFASGCDGKDCYKMYYIKLDIDISSLNIQKEELSEVKWFSMDELKNMVNKKILNQDQIDFFIKCEKYINNEVK